MAVVPFSEVVFRAENDWSPVGRTLSCNAAQLRHFLVKPFSLGVAGEVL